jgi:hypothetical protein
MAAEWYLKIADKEASPWIWSTVGPVSAQELRTMAGKGEITPEDLVRRGSEGAWVPASRVKGLLSGAAAADETPSEAIPVAKLLTPADRKSSKAKTPSTTAPAHKKKPEPGKKAKAIEEPAAESSLPPVVAKGSVHATPAPMPSSSVPPLPVATVPVANEGAASSPTVSEAEAEPAIVPPSRHSPGIDLPFDVSPPTPSGSHPRAAAAEKPSAAGPGKMPAAKAAPKFQINYTTVAVAVVVVVAAGMFIFVSMSGSGSKAGKGDKQVAGTSSEKSPDETTKPAQTSPADGTKQPASDDLMGLMLDKTGKPMGPAKPPAAGAKSQEKKPDKTDTAAKEKWFDVSKGPAVSKNVSIAVKSAKLGKFIQVGRSKRSMGMKLTLEITNKIKNDSLKLVTLRQVQPDRMLVDNFDHAYSLKGITFKSEEAIDPEESSDVDLIFEKPFKTATYLHLKLPGTIFNEPDSINIEIPKEKIEPAEENADEEPAQGPPDSGKVPPVRSDPGHVEKIPGVTAPPDSDAPPPLKIERWQPRGDRDVELADAQRGAAGAGREQRITDFDDDPATVERFGQPSRRDPDRKGSRHAVQR